MSEMEQVAVDSSLVIAHPINVLSLKEPLVKHLQCMSDNLSLQYIAESGNKCFEHVCLFDFNVQ